MEPVTTLAGLASTAKTLGDMLLSISDTGKKKQLEAVRAQIELARAQLEAVVKERDLLASKNNELRAENMALAEKVGHFELSVEYDMREGLLFKKGTTDGLYCQVDRYQMTFQGHESEKKKWKCPKCGQEAKTIDPELADDYKGGVPIAKWAPNPMSDYRG